MMSKGYDIYKPLRNILRKYDLWSGLFTAYRYMIYLDFQIPLPQHFKPSGLFTKSDNWRKGLLQWEFEILIREIILNCPEKGGHKFKNVKDVSRCINKIKSVENEIYGAHEKEQDDVLYEIVRIAHRQFPWQTGINEAFIGRYHWLYRQEGLDSEVRAVFGMSITELMQISLSLTGHFSRVPLLDRPVQNQINNVTPQITEKYLDRLKINLSDLRESYRKCAAYDVNWAYTFNILRDKPLLECPDGRIACLIPDFLVRRVTSGIYFDLIKNPVVGSRYLGPAVQNLVGRVLDSSSADGRMKVKDERSYGTKREKKDSIDWVISDNTAHLFVECKAARVRFKGMSDLKDREQIRKEFDRIRSFAVQSYKTIWDALSGEYPHWKPDQLPCYLAIVTLEDWQSFGLHIEREVMHPLSAELAALGIDPNLPQLVPMTFCAIADFEAALEVSRMNGIKSLFEKKREGEYPQWALGTYITTKHADTLRDFEPKAFSEEWKILDSSST